MRDFARSDDAAVQKQLDRLGALSVPDGRLGLETIAALLARLDNPHRRLPPVFHVAGTNGKGSTCAFLRAMLEAQGLRVHVTTSPHLVRYNERIRVAGRLIEDARLAELLAQVLDAGEDLSPSFFEVTIAAAFTEFARVPADACLVEVGLGGRFDATNVLAPDVLAACGIAALGIDHERFLLAPEDGVPEDPLSRIAFEKMGIAKPGVPVSALAPPSAEAGATMLRLATDRKLDLQVEGFDWAYRTDGDTMRVTAAGTELVLPLPTLPGRHQLANAALASTMILSQDRITISAEAMAEGVRKAIWPARLQLMRSGELTGKREVWLDGGHNCDAGKVLAQHFRGRHLHLVIGMLEAKDPQAITGPLEGCLESKTIVPVPGHDWHAANRFGPDAKAASDLTEAIAALPDDGLPVLIAGSLYLAGEALRLNGELPD